MVSTVRVAVLLLILVTSEVLPQQAWAAQSAPTIVGWGGGTPGEVVQWGEQGRMAAVGAGARSGIALGDDGTVFEWGTPANPVPSGLAGVIGISVGPAHTMALKQDGTVVAWGSSYFGQTNVPTGLSNVVAIGAAKYHSLAVKQDGTVVAWGDNYFGQTSVPSGLSNVVAVAGGESYSVALKGDGTVVAWGAFYGGAGYVPPTPPAGLGGVTAIAGGDDHVLALKGDGTVVAWGYGWYPDLKITGPVAVPAGLSDAIAIAAGFDVSLALKRDGTVVAWGTRTPEAPPNGLSNVVAIALGWWHCLAVVYSGPLAPGIAQEPATQTAESGSAVRLSLVADGAPFLSYRWLFQGTNLLQCGPSSVLDLRNVDTAQAGAYSVIITNRYGSVTSSPAMLSIIPPTRRSPVPVLRISGEVGSQVHLSQMDTLSSVAGWQELGTVRLTESSNFYFDESEPFPVQRFYRAWQTNVPAVRPEVQVSMATKLTIDGTLGSKVRLDYISRYGPTDAWVTLDTLTLTNTTESYLDLTAFGQPPRLYRVVAVP